MLKTRSVALSPSVAAFAVLGAGCQSRAGNTPVTAAADNTADVCDAFRHFEADHRDEPGPARAVTAGMAGPSTPSPPP